MRRKSVMSRSQSSPPNLTSRLDSAEGASTSAPTDDDVHRAQSLRDGDLEAALGTGRAQGPAASNISQRPGQATPLNPMQLSSGSLPPLAAIIASASASSDGLRPTVSSLRDWAMPQAQNLAVQSRRASTDHASSAHTESESVAESANSPSTSSSDSSSTIPVIFGAALMRFMRLHQLLDTLHSFTSIVFKVIVSVATITVLSINWSNDCIMLRVWLLVNLGMIVSNVLSSMLANYAFQRQRMHAFGLLGGYLHLLINVLWGVWILVGVVFIGVYAKCSRTSLGPYVLTAVTSLSLLLLSQWYSIVMAILMCLPISEEYRQLAAEWLGPGGRAATDEEIKDLKTVKYEDGMFEDENDRRCAICLTDYEVGDDLRALPCGPIAEDGGRNRGHYFHTDCIDRWLKQQAQCPICRQDIAEDQRNKDSDDQDLGLGQRMSRWSFESYLLGMASSDDPQSSGSENADHEEARDLEQGASQTSYATAEGTVGSTIQDPQLPER